MPPVPDNAPTSMLLVEDCFVSQDAGFLAALRGITSPELLVAPRNVIPPDRSYAELLAKLHARLEVPRIVTPRAGQTRKVRSYDYAAGKYMRAAVAPRMPKNGRLFTYRTRYYLRRRGWR